MKRKRLGIILLIFIAFAVILVATLVWSATGSISVNWTDNTEPDLDHYNVYRSTVQGGPYVKVNVDNVSQSDFFDSGLPDSTTYYYVVTAVDLAGNESGYSDEAFATVTDLTPPAPPIGLIVNMIGN